MHILADTTLVKSLRNLDYVKILLDGCNSLEERFAKIDSHMVLAQLKTERKNRQQIGPEMKKTVQRPDLPERLTLLLAGKQY